MNQDVCLKAFLSRDRRFAGRFYVGVRTTGIYCRPGCPARLPRPSNVHFFPCAAAAEDAGFRACLRCRPETAPGTPAWLGTSAVVSRALKQIEEGEADGLSMQALAERFGVGARHLRRLFAEHVGASPAAVSRTRRLHFARRLIDETRLPMTEVALGAGFTSIRRFNEAMRASFGRTPRELRRLGRGTKENAGALTLRLPYRPPFQFDSLLAFFAARALPGVEAVSGGAYRRAIAFDGGRASGWVEVAPTPGEPSLSLTVHLAASKHLLEVAERTSRLFDLAADPREVNAALKRDPLLSPLVAARPGLRVPGAWDPFELAVRAVLGQQISVAAARTLAGRIVERYGRPLAAPGAPGLTHVFPEPEALAEAPLEKEGVVTARAETIRRLSRAVACGDVSFSTAKSLDDAVSALLEIPGIGPWTAHVIAMRALREPDAFPAGDLGVRRALARDGRVPSAAEVEAMAEALRPWRAYAAVHLWALDSEKEKTR